MIAAELGIKQETPSLWQERSASSGALVPVRAVKATGSRRSHKMSRLG